MPASDSHKLPKARTYTPLDAFRYHDTGDVYVYLNEPGHRLPERFVPASEADELRNALRCIRAYCPNQPTSHGADNAFGRIIWVCKAALGDSA
jgi:hypothetical protein